MIGKWRNQKEISSPQTEGWEKTKIHVGTYTKKTYRKSSEQLFPNRWSNSYPKFAENIKTYIRLKQHNKLTKNTHTHKEKHLHRFHC